MTKWKPITGRALRRAAQDLEVDDFVAGWRLPRQSTRVVLGADGLVYGPRLYLSPEQLRGLADLVGERAATLEPVERAEEDIPF